MSNQRDYLTSRYPERYFRLWWEYLRRSKDYKEICSWFSNKKDNPSLELPEKFILNKKQKLFHEIIHIYKRHGNVHVGSFKDWYEYKKNVLDLNEEFYKKIIIGEYPEFVKGDINGAINLLKNLLGRKPTIDEFQLFLDNDLYEDHLPMYVIQPFALEPKTVIEIIRKKISGGGYRRPAHRYDELERYLKVYDLVKDGKKMKEVIALVDPGAKGDNVHVLRSFRRDLSNAKKIISNTEKNKFPGPYSMGDKQNHSF